MIGMSEPGQGRCFAGAPSVDSRPFSFTCRVWVREGGEAGGILGGLGSSPL